MIHLAARAFKQKLVVIPLRLCRKVFRGCPKRSKRLVVTLAKESEVIPAKALRCAQDITGIY